MSQIKGSVQNFKPCWNLSQTISLEPLSGKANGRDYQAVVGVNQTAWALAMRAGTVLSTNEGLVSKEVAVRDQVFNPGALSTSRLRPPRCANCTNGPINAPFGIAQIARITKAATFRMQNGIRPSTSEAPKRARTSDQIVIGLIQFDKSWIGS